MIIYDIALMPAGLDPVIWHQFIKENILLFDSSMKGIAPFKTGADNISLIDISSMKSKDIAILTGYMNKQNETLEKERSESSEIAIGNNKKLLEYLKSINNEE